MSRVIVSVRTADVSDADTVARVATEARTTQAGTTQARTTEGRLTSPTARAVPQGAALRIRAALSHPDVQVLLAEAPDPRDLPVGVLVLRRGELVPLSGSEAAHVEQLWVHPEHRRRGVARALLRAATLHAQHSGLEEVTCAVPPADRDAQRFLARLGFTPLVTRRVVSVAALRRRLGLDPVGARRSGLDQLLARRRREHRQPVGGPSTV